VTVNLVVLAPLATTDCLRELADVP